MADRREMFIRAFESCGIADRERPAAWQLWCAVNDVLDPGYFQLTTNEVMALVSHIVREKAAGRL